MRDRTTRREPAINPDDFMDPSGDVTELPDDFEGRVRLFPLPGLVMFPHAMQPLHIFEPRYCEMLSEAMASDQLIAMATLSDAAAAGSQASPPVESTVCLGRVVSHTELEDDRHNILLVGIRRARIRSELETGRSFRMAQVDINEDVYPADGSKTRRALKGKLLDAFGRIIPQNQSVQKNLYDLMAGQMQLGPITDIISYMMPFSTGRKLELLSLANVDRRADRLVDFLSDGSISIEAMSVEAQSGSIESLNVSSATGDEDEGPGFPPPFSLN